MGREKRGGAEDALGLMLPNNIYLNHNYLRMVKEIMTKTI
jgi:hypothetical protein